MYTRINFCVNRLRYDVCMKELKRKNGTLSTIQPENSDEEKFVEVEAYFNNLEEANSFIYSCYFNYGLYFYLKTMAFTSNVF